MDIDIYKMKIDWDNIRNYINGKTGHYYSKCYLQSVKNGTHRNKTIEKIYEELGLKK